MDRDLVKVSKLKKKLVENLWKLRKFSFYLIKQAKKCKVFHGIFTFLGGCDILKNTFENPWTNSYIISRMFEHF